MPSNAKQQLDNTENQLDQRFQELKRLRAESSVLEEDYQQANAFLLKIWDKQNKQKRELAVLEEHQKRFNDMPDDKKIEARQRAPGRYENLGDRIAEARNKCMDLDGKAVHAEKKANHAFAEWTGKNQECKQQLAACKDAYNNYDKLSAAYLADLSKPKPPEPPREVKMPASPYWWMQQPTPQQPSPVAAPSTPPSTPSVQPVAQAMAKMENIDQVRENAFKKLEGEVAHASYLVTQSNNEKLSPQERQSYLNQVSEQLLVAEKALAAYALVKPEAQKIIAEASSAADKVLASGQDRSASSKVDESATIIRRRP